MSSRLASWVRGVSRVRPPHRVFRVDDAIPHRLCLLFWPLGGGKIGRLFFTAEVPLRGPRGHARNFDQGCSCAQTIVWNNEV